MAQVGFTPSFRFEPNERIFTVGSCFARNIERHLQQLGFELPALALQLPPEERASDTDNDFLNKYPPHAVLNELRWALGGSSFPEAAYLQLGPDSWHDPHSAPNLTPAPLSRVRERREMVDSLYRQAPHCRVVVMTLGLVEAWYDQEIGAYLNGAPPRRVAEKTPHRFRLDVLSTDEIEAVLFDIHDLLLKRGHPDLKMLLTVSPVPLRATFRGDDAIVANSYSKSALRAAAERFVRHRSGIDYFPSYEIVAHTHRASAYIQDNRHVTDDVVRVIVERVAEAYCGDEPVAQFALGPRNTASRVREAWRGGDHREAVKLLASLNVGDRFVRAGYTEARYRFEYGKALLRTGSIAEAQAHLSKSVLLDPTNGACFYQLGRALARLPRPLEAEQAFKRGAELSPHNLTYRLSWARQLFANGDTASAAELANAILLEDPDHEGAADLLLETSRESSEPSLRPSQTRQSPPLRNLGRFRGALSRALNNWGRADERSGP